MTTTNVQTHPRFTPSLNAYLEQNSAQLKADKDATKYSCYQRHFTNTKAAINNAFQGIETNSALILGVGAAQDIDLRALALAFEKVRLVDIDLSQTERALQSQVPEADLRAKFTLETADLTGIFPELCLEVEKLAETNPSYDKFVNSILDLLPTLKPATFSYQMDKSSFVCSSLVGTQLIGTLVGYLSQYTQEKYSKPFAAPEHREVEFNTFLTNLVEAHLRALNALVSPSGRIYYADHFTEKGVVHITHPRNPELKNFVQELGESGFPFTQNLDALIHKVSKVVSQAKWGWGLPIDVSMQTATSKNDDGTVEKIPIKVTEFREYQIDSYVLQQRSEVAEGKK